MTRALSRAGLVVATLFFAASLAPSLLPRSPLFQGVVSGLSLVAGYACGNAGAWLWAFFGLPMASGPTGRVLLGVTAGVSGALALTALWLASGWQNAVRSVMGLDPEPGIRPLTVTVVAALVFGAVLFVARLFWRTMTTLSTRLGARVPTRVAYVLGTVVTLLIFWGTVDRVFLAWALRVADRVSQEVDAAVSPDTARPEDPQRTGSASSLIDWQDLGQAGRRFVSSGPTAADLSGFHGEPCPTPIRVYVGLNAAESPEARARLALRELQRVGAFERAVLLLVTPTGTGWVDPAALDPLEYLQRGDVASVAVQYSYLPSVLALPTEGAYGAETARALFDVVYTYWSQLPRHERPALYLYGLSLGALNSDLSFDVHDIIADPFQGVLWVGPPFRGEHWRSITERREPGSPLWRPVFRDGSVVRFMNQQGGLAEGDAPWGPFRIAYLQHASDPITFFTVDSLYREPAWLQAPRAFDVSPSFRWFPIVTSLQLVADIAVGNLAPPGFGHSFAASHHIDAWLALMEPRGWPPARVAALKRLHDPMQAGPMHLGTGVAAAPQ